jgi:hypothetical protein
MFPIRRRRVASELFSLRERTSEPSASYFLFRSHGIGNARRNKPCQPERLCANGSPFPIHCVAVEPAFSFVVAGPEMS